MDKKNDLDSYWSDCFICKRIRPDARQKERKERAKALKQEGRND